MKKINWKFLLLTCVICLIPIIFGVSLYEKLPNEIVIHWDVNNTPNGFADKNFFVFGVPIIMVALQIFVCIINDIDSNKKRNNITFEIFTKSIIPITTIVLYAVTILWALGNEIDIRKIACFLVGVIITMMGVYMPKVGYEESKRLQKSLFLRTEEVWEKVKTKFGYSYIITGLLMILSIFFKPIVSLIAVCFMIIVAVSVSVYAIFLSAKKK